MKKIWITLLFVLMFVTGCTTDEIKQPISDDAVEIEIIDVGQGSAALITTGKQTLLIDAGENDQGNKVVEECKKRGITKIDYAIGTHPHSDHIGGMDTVINNLKVDTLYIPNKIHTSKTFEDVLDAVENQNVNLKIPSVGEKLQFDNGATLTFLAPNESKDYGDSNLNAWSIVAKFQFGDISYLTGGDCDYQGLADLLASNQDLSSTIYQAFHHGSSNGTNSDELLHAISPKMVIMSVGAGNSYGHPHQEFLSMIQSNHYESYRTDNNGNITITIQNNEYRVSTEKNDEIPIPETSAVTGKVIGNVNSKKYHLEDCSNLPYEKNRIYFDSAEQAESNGYTASKDCIH